MNEDRFVYVEQDPPVWGEERKRDYKRQYQAWHYKNDPHFREDAIAAVIASVARKRQRILAVARQYGATLAVAVGLMLPGVASAQEPPKCPSLRDVSTVLREQFKEAPIATWLDKPTGDVVTLFAGESGESTTLVISRGECAAVIAEGAMLRTWAIVGGEEA